MAALRRELAHELRVRWRRDRSKAVFVMKVLGPLPGA